MNNTVEALVANESQTTIYAGGSFTNAGGQFAVFVAAWKSGHFHNLEEAARIPLGIDEPDYYTPAWALDEEEWDDDAQG